ncbi:signal peptidase I [Limnochorda pilosa]|uniref:Signal peptidase I n=1 Tax=Limnochorda pilosa TaxID=1555112 RepID=A0A0K2SQ92_LIMPI|nr:signal peptidase I [Limnochorda pilosa]BAS29295.1 signal peptidase I [Limnochorda pilosa]
MDRESLVEWVRSFALAGVVALFIVTFVARPYVVEGRSMEPTLHDRDRLIVEKLSYRFSDPHQGDIVVLRSPMEPGRRLIKRVIGLPGDQVSISLGKVWVNGRALDEPYVDATVTGFMPPRQVPADSYFVMGDNRHPQMSLDSRTFGFVERDALEGRAIVRFWPITAVSLVTAAATAR